MGHFGFFDWFAMKAGWTILYGPANASCAKGGSKGNFTFPWYVENSSSSFFMAAQTIQLHLVTRSMTETPKKYDIMTSSVFSFQKLCKILNWNTFQSSEVCDNLETCVSFTMDLMCVCVCSGPSRFQLPAVQQPPWSPALSATWLRHWGWGHPHMRPPAVSWPARHING